MSNLENSANSNSLTGDGVLRQSGDRSRTPSQSINWTDFDAGAISKALGHTLPANTIEIALANPKGIHGPRIARLNMTGSAMLRFVLDEVASAGPEPTNYDTIHRQFASLNTTEGLARSLKRTEIARNVTHLSDFMLQQKFFNLVGLVISEGSPNAADSSLRRILDLPPIHLPGSLRITPVQELLAAEKAAVRESIDYKFTNSDYLSSVFYPSLLKGEGPRDTRRDARLMRIGESVYLLIASIGLRDNESIAQTADPKLALRAAGQFHDRAESLVMEEIIRRSPRPSWGELSQEGDRSQFIKTLIGAVFRDGGYDAALHVVKHIFPLLYEAGHFNTRAFRAMSVTRSSDLRPKVQRHSSEKGRVPKPAQEVKQPEVEGSTPAPHISAKKQARRKQEGEPPKKRDDFKGRLGVILETHGVTAPDYKTVRSGMEGGKPCMRTVLEIRGLNKIKAHAEIKVTEEGQDQKAAEAAAREEAEQLAAEQAVREIHSGGLRIKGGPRGKGKINLQD